MAACQVSPQESNGRPLRSTVWAMDPTRAPHWKALLYACGQQMHTHSQAGKDARYTHATKYSHPHIGPTNKFCSCSPFPTSPPDIQEEHVQSKMMAHRACLTMREP